MTADRWYTWTWIDGEDDEAGNAWIQISDLDGEEYAVIMCRNVESVRADHPEWISQKENAARHICEALNFHASHAEYISERGGL